jgi:predicted phosphodiesterase
MTAGGLLMLTSKRYDKRVTAPLWYVIQEWVVLPAIPTYVFLVFFLQGASRVGAIVGLLLAITIRVVMVRRKTHQRISHLVMETTAIVGDILYFVVELAVKPIYRVAHFLRTTARAVGILFLELVPRHLIQRVAQPQGDEQEMHASSTSELAGNDCNEQGETLALGTLRIVHVSDLHIRPQGIGDLEHGAVQASVLQARLIAEVAAARPNVVVVSGDITDTGSAADYRSAEIFFERLRKKIGDCPVIVTPGNHDLSVSPTIWTVKVNGWMRTVANAAGSATRPFYRPFEVRCLRFNRFAESIGMRTTSSLRGVNLINIPEHDLSVVTLNTAMPNSWIGFNGAGEFSRAAMRDLEAMSSSLRSRLLVVCHHHARSPEGDLVFQKGLNVFKYAHLCAGGSMRLADTLIRALDRNESNCIVLHGHTHIPRNYHIVAPGKPDVRLQVRCAPAAIDGPAPGLLLHLWGTQLKTILSTWKPSHE